MAYANGVCYLKGVVSSLPQTVAETNAYLLRAEKLLTEAEREEVVLLVATNPTAAPLIQGTGGVRGGANRGKSGGFRIIYFFYDDTMPIYLLTAFAKNQRANLTQAERNQLRALTTLLVAAHKERT